VVRGEASLVFFAAAAQRNHPAQVRNFVCVPVPYENESGTKVWCVYRCSTITSQGCRAR